MEPAPSPQPKGSISVKKVVFVLLGIAAVAWYIGQRNTPTASAPLRSGHNSMANDMSAGTRAPTPPPTTGAPAAAQDESVERYPMIASPEQVQPEKEFPIAVSLTEEAHSDVSILSGNQTDEGRLKLSLPAGHESWKLDVYLTGKGLEFTQGTGSGTIDLPRRGDPAPATFLVKASQRAATDGVLHVMATFAYEAVPLARIERDIKITSASPTVGAEVTTAKVSAAPSSMEISDQVPQPDLALYIKGDTVLVLSPWLGSSRGSLPNLKGFADFLAHRSPASAGRGSEPVDSERAADEAEGFGQTLYDNYAPDVFKTAFWRLVQMRGARFRTIQIYSDQPDIPWELMRPRPPDGTGQRQDFLGLNYSVARWDNNDGILLEHPPYHESMPKMFVIAPHYSGSRSLDGEAAETQELARLNGYSPVDGNRKAVKALFRNPPQGIVHFAGHGQLDAAHDEFEILLEDGQLDVQSWRSMADAGLLSHTFFFFNACDVGQAKETGNFVDGFGPAVLSKGASGYIGALWPVNDQVAAKFSVRFYQLLQEQMQHGPADVSETLRRTRKEIYDGKNPTALAYVLYGDTNLKFVRADQ
jgi:hypothetical protein